MANAVDKAVFLLIVFLVIFSGIMAISDKTNSGFCIINSGASECASVQNSQYGSIFGIKLTLFGFASFLLLFLVYIFSFVKNKYSKNFSEIYIIMSGIGCAFALYFIYLQFFVLKTLCANCIVVDSLMVVVFILSLYRNRKKRR